MSTALDAIFADTASGLEIVAEIDSAKRSDGSLQTWYVSTHMRSDTPAATTAFFLPFLPLGGTLGPLAQSVAEDVLFSGLAQNNPGTLTLLQTDIDPDLLSVMNDYVFAGYQCRVMVGRETDDYDDFERYRTVTIDIDPSVVLTEEGIQATFPLAGALTRTLNETLNVGRYLGVPNCLRVLTTTGTVAVTRIAAYDLTRFTCMIMFRTKNGNPTASNLALHRKQVSSTTDCNWNIRLMQTSGFINFLTTSGGAVDVNITSSVSYADNNWHRAIFSQDAGVVAYGAVDKEMIGTVDPAGSPNLSVASILFANGNGDDVEVCDARLYDRYIPFEEAVGLASTRSPVDALNLIGLWVFDDNTGGTVNDYSSNNNDGAIGGVVNTDYSWQPSDLGSAGLAGELHPLTVGNVLNAKADLIGDKRWRGNTDEVGWFSSGSNSNLTVKSQGTVLSPSTDYNAPSNGGGGVFSTTSAESEPVTYDLLNNGTAEEATYPAAVAEFVLTERSRLTLSDVSNVDPMLLLCPWPSGYHTKQEATAQSALREILGESGMCYFEEPLGSLQIDMVLPPTGYGPYGEPCLDLRGAAGNHVTWPQDVDITGTMTLACWFKSHQTDQTAFNLGGTEPNLGTFYLISKGDTSGNYALWYQSAGSNAGKFGFRTGGVTAHSDAGLIEPNSWYFVAAAFTGGGLNFHVEKLGNNHQFAQTIVLNYTPTPVPDNDPITVGSDASSNWGSIQHAQVWNVSKTVLQVSQLMTTPPVGNEANLLFYAPLNEGTGSPSNLVASSTGTINGTVQWAPKLLIDLNTTPSVTLTNFHHLDPAHSIIVKYAKNRHPLSESDIDTGITNPDQRRALTRSGLSVPFDSATAHDLFKAAKRIVLDSPITDQESAERLLRTIQQRFGTDAYVGTLEFPPGLNISRLACGLQIGDEIGLTATIPSQLQTPRSFRVVAVAPDPIQLSTTIAFVG